jgi:hypothetical protein
VSSDRLAGPIRDNFAIVGRALTEAAVRSVRVVMLDVLVQELLELVVVPDEGPVAEFAADGPDPSFGVGVRDRRVRRGADDPGAVAVKDVVEAGEELVGAGNAFGCSANVVDVDVGAWVGERARVEADVDVMGWPLSESFRLLGGTR